MRERWVTSVGHEDLQGGVLQQVASGEDSADLREQPFPVEALGVRQDLRGKALNKQWNHNKGEAQRMTEGERRKRWRGIAAARTTPFITLG